MSNILPILFLLLICSCRPPSYYPSQQIPPRLAKQGNVQASLGLGSGFEYTYHLAASPINHLGIYIGNQRILPKYTDYKHKLTEGGVGYYFFTSSGNYWSLYASYGFGSVDAQNKNRYVENSFDRYSFTVMNSPKLGGKYITTALRCDYNKMYKYSRYHIIDGVKTYTATGKRNRFLIGPMLGTTFTGPTSIFQTQIGCSASIENTSIGKWISAVYVYASAAVVLDFNFR